MNKREGERTRWMNEWVRLAAFGSLFGRRVGSSNPRVEMRAAIERHARETKLENRNNYLHRGSAAAEHPVHLKSLSRTHFSPYNLMWTMRRKTARHLATFSLASQPSRRITPEPKNFHSAGNFKKDLQSMSSSLSLSVPLGLALQ